ncbi:peroxidase family protein [Mycoplana ramosa]|uniref:Heme peroxidase n=1 Tax=Mycoplana ramosa TaxID=40837 RepID=A0ABW3YXN2_MYCRA
MVTRRHRGLAVGAGATSRGHAPHPRNISEPSLTSIEMLAPRNTEPAPVDRGDPAPHRPFKRCFGSTSEAELPDASVLCELGAAFRFNVTDTEVETQIPVGYTYLCQFLFHDLTSMVADAGGEPFNLHSGQLNLDSVFGSSTTDPTNPATPMAIGRTAPAARLCDLPRDSSGRAMIADPRNDDNLALAQTHMAMIRFYNAIVARYPGLSERSARALAVTHVQSVALHDLLPRLVDPVVYDDVMQNGRSVIHADPQETKFLIPLEFAAACARFGHSMIRTVYQHWNAANPGAMLFGFWKNTYNSSDPPLDGTLDEPRTRLSDRWIAAWERLLSERPSPTGQPPLFASRIDTVFAYPLARIPQIALPVLASSSLLPSTNIATLSLLRGLSLRLSSGQAVARQVLAAVVDRGGPAFPILTSDQIVQDEPEAARTLLTQPRNGARPLAESTPLLLYTLKEAAILSQGMRLGPMGSRIVMETLHAAIEAAQHSILAARWKPDPGLKPTAGDCYTFADLICFAGLSNQ